MPTPLPALNTQLDLERYMASEYVNGGRVWPQWDCWGLVRQAFIDIHGIYLPMLDNLDAADTLGKSRHHKTITDSHLVASEPCHGAIAAQVSGKVCEHVGLTIELAGKLYVMETDKGTGPRIVSLEEFIKERVNVRYYAPA